MYCRGPIGLRSLFQLYLFKTFLHDISADRVIVLRTAKSSGYDVIFKIEKLPQIILNKPLEKHDIGTLMNELMEFIYTFFKALHEK